MKTITKSFILLAIVVFAIISCEKDDEIIVDLNNSPFIGTWTWAESSSQFSFGFSFTQEDFIFFETEGDYFNSDSGTYSYTDSTIIFNWQGILEYYPHYVIGEYPFELEYAFIEHRLQIGERFYIKEE